jgi:hypothetical protein
MIELVGCTTVELKAYIESKFSDGMSWDRYLAGDIHIDHIIPTCSFDLRDSEHRKQAFHFLNLRPLWAKENLIKAAMDRKQSIRLALHTEA